MKYEIFLFQEVNTSQREMQKFAAAAPGAQWQCFWTLADPSARHWEDAPAGGVVILVRRTVKRPTWAMEFGPVGHVVCCRVGHQVVLNVYAQRQDTSQKTFEFLQGENRNSSRFCRGLLASGAQVTYPKDGCGGCRTGTDVIDFPISNSLQITCEAAPERVSDHRPVILLFQGHDLDQGEKLELVPCNTYLPKSEKDISAWTNHLTSQWTAHSAAEHMLSVDGVENREGLSSQKKVDLTWKRTNLVLEQFLLGAARRCPLRMVTTKKPHRCKRSLKLSSGRKMQLFNNPIMQLRPAMFESCGAYGEDWRIGGFDNNMVKVSALVPRSGSRAPGALTGTPVARLL